MLTGVDCSVAYRISLEQRSPERYCIRQEMTLDSAVLDWMRQSRIDGLIARVDTHNIESLRELNTRIVDVRYNRKFAGIPQAETDNQRVAELAFEQLWNRGFRRFAFAGFGSRPTRRGTYLLHFDEFLEM